jgi:hypothetical protein
VVPYKNTRWEEEVIKFIKDGGKVIIVGALDNASEKLLDLLQIGFKSNDGKNEFVLDFNCLKDKALDGIYSKKLFVNELENTYLLNTVNLAENDEDTMVTEDGYLIGKGKGNVYWYRGIMTGNYIPGNTLISFPSEGERVSGGALLRNAARYFGWDIRLEKADINSLSPIISVSRHNNGTWFSMCLPDATVGVSLRTPYGAPLFLGHEAVYKNGMASYRCSRAEHRECRIFIEQGDDSIVSCREMFPGGLDPQEKGRRRISISGLKNATIRYFPETYAIGKCWALMSEPNDRYTADYSHEVTFVQDGNSYVAKNVSGIMVVYMPDYEDWDTRYVEQASKFD